MNNRLPISTSLLVLLSYLVLGVPSSGVAQPGTISTVSGGGSGGDLGPATDAHLFTPARIGFDSDGSIFISDPGDHRVRRINIEGFDITAVAGTGGTGFSGDGGQAIDATMSSNIGIVGDASGNLYIADVDNHRIRRVDGGTGVITTIAGTGVGAFSGDGGFATAAELNRPNDVTIDSAGNLYVADTANERIRRIDGVSGIISTVAGTGVGGFSGDFGPAAAATISQVTGLTVDSSGNIYTASIGNGRIRKFAPGGIISTVAGGGGGGEGGLATAASLLIPRDVAVDASGNVYIADEQANKIYVVSPITLIITRFAGNGQWGFSGDGGLATAAELRSPTGVSVDAAGDVFIADQGNNRVRIVNPILGLINTVAGGNNGDGNAASASRLGVVTHVAMDATGNVFVADNTMNQVRRIDAQTGIISTVAGVGSTGGPTSGDGGPATAANFQGIEGLAIDASGNLFIIDLFRQRVRRVDALTGIITTFAGNGTDGFGGDDGPAATAALNFPSGLSADSAGNIYIADTRNHRMRMVDASTYIITTVAGNGTEGKSGDGGLATSAMLNFPSGVTVDATGNIFISDTNNHTVRRVDAVTGNISTVAGSESGFAGDGGAALSAELNYPRASFVDALGLLYITDHGNNRIRKVNGPGIVTTIAGSGASGLGSGSYSGDGGPATQATLSTPNNAVLDANGTLYIADRDNRRVRQMELIPQPPVELSLQSDLAAPGTTLRIPVMLTNLSDLVVGGLQFDIGTEESSITFSGLDNTDANPGFDVAANVIEGGQVVLINSLTGAGIDPGEDILLLTLLFDVDSEAELGTSVDLLLESVIVGDVNANEMSVVAEAGEGQVGIPGDIDLSGSITILDIIRTVRIIIGNDVQPDDGTVAFNIADLASDGTINIVDLIAQVNSILGGSPKPVANAPVQPVEVSLASARIMDNGVLAVPIMLNSDGLVAGMQATLSFETNALELGLPLLAIDVPNIEIFSYLEDNKLRIVTLGLSAGTGLPAGETIIINIPVSFRDEYLGTSLITLEEVILANGSGIIALAPGNVEVSIFRMKSSNPIAFSLAGAAPNPFNPSTIIWFEVPEPAMITLNVYNILGQEVARLADGLHNPGRYSVTWDGRDSHGNALASGVYLYRITSESGFSDTRRMVLLK